jgi:hypothetical protein
MGSSSNGTSSFCKGKAKDDVVGSRLTGCLCSLPLKQSYLKVNIGKLESV